MIDQGLINKAKASIDKHEGFHPQYTQELLDCYIKLVEQNAELHKELAKVKQINKDMHKVVSGYLSGDEWQHWNNFNAGDFKCE